MPLSEFEIFHGRHRSNWVSLRTLVTLRWLAIIGQSIAVFVAIKFYDLQISFGLAILVISCSAIANVTFTLIYPENKRLSEREATLMLVFDIVQLSLLLLVTGGLNNPFAMLVLAPVTIAATVLHLRSTIMLGITAIVLVTLIGSFNLPIRTSTGITLILPDLFQFGFWLALVIGVIFLAIYARQVTSEMHAMGEALVATQLALAREQKLTDLGGVVAAAAHELGTPLATIKLVSSELMEELENHPELLEDANLIKQQVDRCRNILHSMGRAGKDDLHLRRAPLEAIVREAAEPHLSRGKNVVFAIKPEWENQPQPTIQRRPEIIHGLRNLIQNAVDFSTGKVEINVAWDDISVTITISDDGPGFPQSVIGRIGDPYVRRRRSSEDGKRRPGYKGMGLGLFIAKTLLERSHADLTFENARRHGHTGWSGQATGGAIVTAKWKMSDLVPDDITTSGALGENTLNEPQ